MSSVYSCSYLEATQPGTSLGGRVKRSTSSQSASAPRRYPVETVNVSQEDTVSMITDPRFIRSVGKESDMPSAKKSVKWKLADKCDENESDDEYESDKGMSRSSLKKVVQIALITGKTPEEVAIQLLRKENQKKMEKRRNKRLFTDALKGGKTPKEMADFLMKQVEEKRKTSRQAQEQTTAEQKMHRSRMGDRDKRNVNKDGCDVCAACAARATDAKKGPASYVIGSDDDTANSTDPGDMIEVKDDTFTVKLISVDKSHDQEVTLVEDLAKSSSSNNLEQIDSADDGTVMSKTILYEMMSDALQESDDPEKVASYLFQKEKERKLEKAMLEEELTAAVKAGMPPIEIAQVLTKIEKERIKAEEEKRAKKADEDLIMRALKKGKTPGEVAAIIQAEEAKKKVIKDEDNVPENSLLMQLASNVLGVDTVSAEAKRDGNTKAETNMLVEKKNEVHAEIQKLKADLGKAQLIEKEIEKLKSDLSKARMKIKQLEENEQPAFGNPRSFRPLAEEYHKKGRRDYCDDSSNESDFDELEEDPLAGCLTCFSLR